MELIGSIWEKWLFLPYLFGIMIVGGLVKNYGVLNEVFVALRNTFKSNRLVVAATALAGGVLPIEGRVIMSAPLLDSIASDKAQSRSKFGIVDYLASLFIFVLSVKPRRQRLQGFIVALFFFY